MSVRIIAVLLTLLFSPFSPLAFAQAGPAGDAGDAPPQKKRLKIGLVLSGGGGRGVAHIGVLDWFEKHRIPVDYVAGTSIGGLVGGMYATGMSPAEMRDLLNRVDWSRAFGNGPTYDQLAFRRKEDKNTYQTNLEIGLREGVSLPPGISSAHYLGLLIDRLTLPYSSAASFDDLPIPFRCMATDFLKAEPVVLKDGAISSALRATMAIPGVFPPVERDGKVLVDGGLLNNIPTNVMRELRPDVVIAVDVGTHLGDLKAIASFLGILEQAVTVMTTDADRRNLRLADIIIAPELGSQSALDFSAIEKTVAVGYSAAEAKAAILRNFALDEADWQAYLGARHARQRRAVPVPDAVAVSGVDGEARRRIRDKLQDFVGVEFDADRLEKRLTGVTGQGRYDSLGYGVIPDPRQQGRHVLAIGVRPKTHAPPTLNFGLEIDGADVNDIHFTLGARLTMFDVGRDNTEWRHDARLGFRTLLSSEYYLPLGGDGFFVAPRAFYRRETQDLFQGRERLAEYQANYVATGLDVGHAWRDGELRLGYEVGALYADARAGDPGFKLDGRVSLARARYAYDGLDSPTVPSRGVRWVTEGRWYFDAPGAASAFPQAESRLAVFRPVGRGAAFLAGAGGTSFDHTAAPAQQFTLGGPFRLGAYDLDEFRGDHYGLAAGGYLHPLYQLSPLVGGKVYAVGWVDTGGAFGGPRASGLRHALSLGVIADTRLGPFSLIGAYGEGGRGKVYFSFGKFF